MDLYEVVLMVFFHKYYNQITGYIFVTPAVILISLFGIFPVFFGFYMSFHKAFQNKKSNSLLELNQSLLNEFEIE